MVFGDDRAAPATLSISRRVLGALVWLNAIYGVLLTVLLIAALISPDTVFGAMGLTGPDGPRSPFIPILILIVVLGVATAPLTHVVLTRLLAIVDTVSVGSPFVGENAKRLRTIAWAVLGMELVHLGIGISAALASIVARPIDLDWKFSVTRWLVVLLLFVLARVFEKGTQMRDELDGTV